MERLTAKNECGDVYYPHCDNTKGCGCYCGNCEFNTKISNKLAEYEQAEEAGLLIRLPVAEGSEVYVIDYVYECKYEFECPLPYNEYKCEEELPCENQYKRYRVRETKFNHLMLVKIGKTVFLTKAEAEQALAKMKGE